MVDVADHTTGSFHPCLGGAQSVAVRTLIWRGPEFSVSHLTEMAHLTRRQNEVCYVTGNVLPAGNACSFGSWSA